MGGGLGPVGARTFAALAIVALPVGLPACSRSRYVGSTNDANEASILDGSDAADDADPESDPDASADGGAAAASFDSTSLTFPSLPCGGAATTLPLHITNNGSGMLAVSAATVGAGFSVTPTVLQVPPGAVSALSVSASADATAAPGASLSGSLQIFTNDPQNAHVSVALSGTPTGAVLSFQGGKSFVFPATEVGFPASPTALTLVNSGNASGTFTLGSPSDPHFVFGSDAGVPTLNLGPGATYALSAGFTPTSTSALTASATVTTSSPTCGSSLQSIVLSGQGSFGVISGWPTTVDFGPADCGGSPPGGQSFILSNTGVVDAVLTVVDLGGVSGFATDARVGQTVPAGGALTVHLTAPAVPQFAPISPVSTTLSLQTDADASPHAITLTEEPSGAVLGFNTSGTTNFGSFGPVVLLQSASAPFQVINTGNAAANVALLPMDGGEAEAGTSPFQVSSPTFSLGATSTQAELVTFTPTTALPVTTQLALTATGAVCSGLPEALSLSGSGVGGAPSISSTSLAFGAVCGGVSPPAQSFIVSNAGSADMNWALGPVTGVGSAQYSVDASPAPGLLTPGASATVIVTAAAVPSPPANALPSAFAAELTVTTDVPLDPPHVVTLGETPLGDQLEFGVASPVRFGQVPIDTSLSQTFTIINAANPGSTPATVSLQIAGAASSGYSVSPAGVSGLAPGGQASGNEALTFSPSAAIPYPATLALVTNDALCSPLPTPLVLSGTGTQGIVSLSTNTLTFGTNALDAAGLVNCGATGLTQQLTITNVGNQALQVTGLALGEGSESPYVLSGPAAALPVTIGIGQSTTLTITPNPIPSNVPNPNNPSPFTDTLTVTTNAALDQPHVVNLVMQARGAVIANTPLATDWTFGTISAGGIATFTSAIQNTGNAAALVGLQGLTQPSVFGIANNPTTAVAGAVTSIVGQFTPPSADGAWSDEGVLVVSAPQAFCAPLPSAWNMPAISFSGTSNGTPSVTLAGSLTFPTTDCGEAAPAGEAVVLSNGTGVVLGYTAHLSSGVYYSLSAGAGTVPASGTASIVVTPQTLTPGPGVQPGSAPYADNLVVTVATSPPTTLSVPVAWTLNGAVLTLPQGSGPQGQGFYVADSTSGFSLPLGNTGTGTATVSVAVQPLGLFMLTPAPPVEVLPGIGASPQFVSSSTAPACPATAVGTATFLYSGAVCQPFPLSSVSVQACAGTY